MDAPLQMQRQKGGRRWRMGELQHVLTGRGNKLESFLHFRPSMRLRSAGEIIVIIIDV